MTPEQTLKQTKELSKQLKIARKANVKVGVLASSATSAIYKSGETVTEIAAVHEFGIGVPKRSFLRVPFSVKRKEIAEAIGKEFRSVSDGQRGAINALARVGIFARNISVLSFRTQGYGKWPSLSPVTTETKGSSQVLIDTGTLRNSISYEVER